MKVSQMFPSKYLAAADLQGHAVTVNISSVSIENVGREDKPENKPVLTFSGKEKGLVLNKTNTMVIADAYGDDTDDWVGKELQLYPDKTQFQGKLVDCLRVRTPVKETDEDIPW